MSRKIMCRSFSGAGVSMWKPSCHEPCYVSETTKQPENLMFAGAQYVSGELPPFVWLTSMYN